MKAFFSQKNGWVKLFGISLLYLILMLSDLGTTYMKSPDLSMEASPLVTILGAGWGALIIGNFIGMGVFLLFAYFPFVHYKRSVIHCKKFKEYVSIMRPKHKVVFLAPIGYTTSIIGIFLKIFAVSNNIGFHPCVFCFFKIPHTYCNMITIQTTGGILFLPVIAATAAIVLAVLAYYFWFFREYKINQKALKSLENKPV